jgi:3-hydroxyisobutyrate dehydrogenase
VNIAIIGCGEVGRCYAETLLGTHSLSLCDPNPQPAARDLAARLGTALHSAPGDWLSKIDLTLSCVVGTASLSAARNCFAHIREGTTFADLTTADPAQIRVAASEAAVLGIQFVDVAIMGAIALSGARTPLLFAGDGAPAVQNLFNACGAKTRILNGGKPGDAAALKLLRSVFTKGMEALSVECLAAAERQNVRTALYDVLSDIDETPLRDFLEMLVRTHVLHAMRRLHEVEEAERQLRLSGLPSLVLPGVRARFEKTVEATTRNRIAASSPSIQEALSWLLSDSSSKSEPSR